MEPLYPAHANRSDDVSDLWGIIARLTEEKAMLRRMVDERDAKLLAEVERLKRGINELWALASSAEFTCRPVAAQFDSMKESE